MDLLQLLDPLPAQPPSYTTANCSGTVRFPVYETPESHILPQYSPAVTALALVLRKVECLSPYEISSSRGWKNLIMELNSTQVNFYSIDGLLLLDHAKLTKGRNNLMFNSIKHDFIISSIEKHPEKYLTQGRLVRSYTLQHASFGLPIDYKKRNYCLRLRLETEQMIVQFANLDEMINWSNNLSTGINVALDLEIREMPNDITVPRRRRRRRNGRIWQSSNRIRSYSDTELIRRELSPPIIGSSSFIHPSAMVKKASVSGESTKKLINKIFGRPRFSTIGSASSSISKSSSLFQKQIGFTEDIEITSSLRLGQEIQSRKSNDEVFVQDEDLQNEEPEIIDEEIPNNEIHSIHNMLGEFDDELINDEEPSTSVTSRISNPLVNGFVFSRSKSYSSEDKKEWKPDYLIISRKKYYKDCIRCIKILTSKESWCGKPIVRSTYGTVYRSSNGSFKSSKSYRYVKEFVVGYSGLVTA